ncbi:hypothetical protein HZC34_03075 [Candidatus Saganbacteria bacterium]|nr:hypothetical protein [Candidatus Saganbacteria bacterium]
MVKKLLVLMVLFGFAVIQWGCGQVAPPASTATAVPTTVTFSGAASASSSDLAKLGATTLGIETLAEKNDRISKLKAKGFDEGSIRALDLRLLAGADVTTALYKINADGSYTKVADGAMTDGTYTCTNSAYSTSETYVIRTTKTSTTASKELSVDAIVDEKATTSSVTGMTSTPQTTLLVKIIVEQVIKATGSAKIEQEIIQYISTLVKNKISYLVTAEGLSLTTVKSTTDTENELLKSAAITAFTDSVIEAAIKAVKFNAGLSKGASSLADAKKIMKEIFTLITGSPTGIPETILNSFAQSFYEGKTKTVDQIAAACNKAVFQTDGTAVTGLYTGASVATMIQTTLEAVYAAKPAASVAASEGPKFEVKNQSPIVQAVFPASSWAGKSISGSTALNVPQIVAMIEALGNVAFAVNYKFNHPAAAVEMGFMSGVADEFSIMHSELRIESWENWQGFHPTSESDRPTVSAILTSFMEVGNIINPKAATTNITAKLIYQKSTGGTRTINYTAQSMFGPKAVSAFARLTAKEAKILAAPIGPPPGFKVFQISPWGGTPGATPETYTDYLLGGLATIEVYNGSTLIISKTNILPAVDLTNAVIDFKNPYPNIFQSSNPLISIFEIGSKPVCSFSFGVGIPTIAFDGLTAAYAIEIREVDATTGMPKFESQAVFSSWHKQEFLKGTQGETTSLKIPVALSTAGTYTIMGAVVGINSDGWPVISGPWRSTLFKVGSAATVASKVVTIEGTVTPPTTPTAGTTVKVGLFKMEWDMNFVSGTITPKTVVTTNGAYSMTISYSDLATAGNGGYDTIAWEDSNGNGKIDGSLGERPFFPAKHLGYFGGTLNAMDNTFKPLGAVTSTQNNTGYDINMGFAFWGPKP